VCASSPCVSHTLRTKERTLVVTRCVPTGMAASDQVGKAEAPQDSVIIMGTECQTTPPNPPLSALTPASTASGLDGIDRTISPTYDEILGREASTLGDLLPADTFKKKKKKRVGGIAFAVQVEEQVIKTNDEEMTMRREHWQAIQERASDPNTVSVHLPWSLPLCLFQYLVA